MPKRRLTAVIELLIVSVIWGLASPVIKTTLVTFPPFVFLTYRFLVSSVIATVYFVRVRPKMTVSTRDATLILLYSVFAVTVGLGLLFIGIERTTALASSVLHSFSPLATMILGALLLRERITKNERIGALIAFAGTIAVVLSPLASGLGTDSLGINMMDGNLLVAIALLMDAGAAVLVKFLERNRIAPETLTHVSFVIGLLTILPFAAYFHTQEQVIEIFRNAGTGAHLGVWYMAVLSGTVAYILRNRAIKSIEVSETSIFTYLIPVWTLPVSVFVLREPLTIPFGIGIVIIVIGVIIAEMRGRHEGIKTTSVRIGHRRQRRHSR